MEIILEKLGRWLPCQRQWF